MSWMEAARVDDIPEYEGLSVQLQGQGIALFRAGDQVYAIDDICPHSKAAQLSLGFLDGTTVECPLHQSCFDIRTGKVLSPPCTEDVRSYPAKVEDGAVLIEL